MQRDGDVEGLGERELEKSHVKSRELKNLVVIPHYAPIHCKWPETQNLALFFHLAKIIC